MFKKKGKKSNAKTKINIVVSKAFTDMMLKNKGKKERKYK
jgi:hypothetical protein